MDIMVCMKDTLVLHRSVQLMVLPVTGISLEEIISSLDHGSM